MIVTNADRMLELLKRADSVSIEDMAKQLNAKPEQIEKLAKYMEEESLIAITFKFTKAFLSLPKQEAKAAKQEHKPVPKDMVEHELDDIIASLQKRDIAADIYNDLLKRGKELEINHKQELYTGCLPKTCRLHELLDITKLRIMLRHFNLTKDNGLVKQMKALLKEIDMTQSRLNQQKFLPDIKAVEELRRTVNAI
jgi:DNA-binding transcriptional regulator YhcF (GntR family)